MRRDWARAPMNFPCRPQVERGRVRRPSLHCLCHDLCYCWRLNLIGCWLGCLLVVDLLGSWLATICHRGSIAFLHFQRANDALDLFSNKLARKKALFISNSNRYIYFLVKNSFRLSLTTLKREKNQNSLVGIIGSFRGVLTGSPPP